MAKTGFIAIPAGKTAVDSAQIETGQWDKITIVQDALAGAEEVAVKIVTGSTLVTATDTTGTAIKLTASIHSYTLPGGPTYVFSRTVTAADTTVYYYPQPY